MPFKLIKGTFHIHYPDIPRQGPEPDGDTLKFRPDNPLLTEALQQPGRAPAFNKRQMVNLRFEGIDALETHFDDMHQQLENALAARDFLLEKAGFQNVQFYDDLPYKVSSVEAHPRRGYILTKEVDPYGRLIAFAFPGDPTWADGRDIYLDGELLDESFNAQLLKAGLAYPLFYTTLPIDLKDHMAEMVENARFEKRGLWAVAEQDAQRPILTIDDLQEVVMWPKLFRRLARFFAAGNARLSDFEEWLRADPLERDDALILPNRELGNMHDVFEVRGQKISMVFPPEELIILADPSHVPSPPPKPFKTGDVRILAALINPIGNDRGKETLTLLNTTAEAVDLQGWYLVDNANSKEILSGKIPPGDTLRVSMEKIMLGNKGDAITLFDPTEAIIDHVQYLRNQTPEEGRTLVF